MLESKTIIKRLSNKIRLINSATTIDCNKLGLVSSHKISKELYFFVSTY